MQLRNFLKSRVWAKILEVSILILEIHELPSNAVQDKPREASVLKRTRSVQPFSYSAGL